MAYHLTLSYLIWRACPPPIDDLGNCIKTVSACLWRVEACKNGGTLQAYKNIPATRSYPSSLSHNPTQAEGALRNHRLQTCHLKPESSMYSSTRYASLSEMPSVVGWVRSCWQLAAALLHSLGNKADIIRCFESNRCQTWRCE